MQERYQLRYAAGIYWLLDMRQDGSEYRKPLPMNETGAFIWNELQAGRAVEEIIKMFSERYQSEAREASEDVGSFIRQLTLLGVLNNEKPE